jgi:glycerol kinase
VTRARVPETTALGAAYLAGLAEGVWGSTDELADLWAGDEPVVPTAARAAADADHARWLEAVSRSRAWEPPG